MNATGFFTRFRFCFCTVHVAEQLDRDDPGYIEALERETAILEKRVVACKSRIMIVTVFDVTNAWHAARRNSHVVRRLIYVRCSDVARLPIVSTPGARPRLLDFGAVERV